MWTYTLDGNLTAVLFSNVTGRVNDFIGVRLGLGKINSTQKYEARFRAQATSTRAELMILAVQLSDEATYQLNLVSSKPTSITHNVKVIVQCKYNLLKYCCMLVMSRSTQFDCALNFEKIVMNIKILRLRRYCIDSCEAFNRIFRVTNYCNNIDNH